MTGTQAAEKEEPGSRADKLHRGRNVVLAFTMQVLVLVLLWKMVTRYSFSPSISQVFSCFFSVLSKLLLSPSTVLILPSSAAA